MANLTFAPNEIFISFSCIWHLDMSIMPREWEGGGGRFVNEYVKSFDQSKLAQSTHSADVFTLYQMTKFSTCRN